MCDLILKVYLDVYIYADQLITMRAILKQVVLFFLLQHVAMAQMPTCPSPYVYMDGGTFIRYYDPGQPLSATNPATINVPTFGSGLALMPNINGGTLTPTFYSVSGGTYWYWNGVQWINTGHTTGNAAAVNLGGCGGAIYNLVGGSGAVYVYNGTGNGSLLTTLQGFNGGGPYDLVTDCNCNFYALNTSTPNQTLTMYNSAGVPQCTYTMSGMPNTTAGGGFAIIGNTIYVKNNLNNGFFIGNITGSSISFTQVPGFNVSPGDFASCPVCYPNTTLTNVSASSGILSCSIPSINLIATTTTSPVSYNWTGPGIIGPTTGSVIAVNAQGIYTCVVSAGGCPPSQASVTSVVISNSTTVIANITPSGNICLPANTPTQLVVAYTTTNAMVSWAGPGIVSGGNTATVQVNASGSYTVSVTDITNGCVGYDVVNIAYNPTVSLAISAPSICAQSINGSPSTVTITLSGAPVYSCYVPGGLFTLTPISGTAYQGNPSPNINGPTYMSVVLTGSNAFCTHSTTAGLMVYPNPVVTISPPTASICPYNNLTYTASGASNYTWTGLSLNNYNSPLVVANPSQTTVYSVQGETGGCYANVQSASLTILPLPIVTAAPLASVVCLGSTVNLVAGGTATHFTWTPSSGLSSVNAASVSASPSVTQGYVLLGALNGCTAQTTATVVIIQPPILNLSLTSNTMCAFNFNNSVNTLSLIPSGAQSYTLLGGNGFVVNNATGPIMQAIASGTPNLPITPVTATLIGVTGVCTTSITKTFSVIDNPVISLLPPTATICPGKSKVFGVTGATSYTWLPNTHYSVLTPTSIIASPPMTNFYSVIGNSSGCNSDTKNAVLLVLPVPDVSVSPVSTTVCAGSSVTLTAIGNAAIYTWSPNIALSAPQGSSVTSTPLVTQSYTVVGTLNTCTNMAVTTVSAIQIPIINSSSADKIVCEGFNTQLFATGANSFSWEPANALVTTTGNTVIANPPANTIYTVHGFNGICTGSSTLSVLTLKRPDVVFQSSQNQICIGKSMTLAVKGADSYTWDPPEGLLWSGTNTIVTLNPTVTTSYTVTGATVSGTLACYSKVAYAVVVKPYVIPEVSEDVAICIGQKTTLRATGGDTYNWIPAYSLNTSTNAGVVANPTTSTRYSVDISWGGVCGTKGSVYVEVMPKPKLFAGRDTTYNLNEPIFINAVGTGTITWLSGDGIKCRACPMSQVYPSGSSCYIAEAINEEGCVVRDEVCLEITKDFSAYIPNTFTPDNDGINDVFYVYGENIFNVTMEIFDRWGARVFISKDQATGWDGSYKGAKCKPDVYSYIITYTGLNGKNFNRAGHVSIVK